MDVVRASLLLTIAASLAGTAFAAPPSQAPPMRNTSDWTNSATAATERYNMQSMTQQVQNGVNSTMNSVGNSINSGIQSTGQQLSTSATNATQQVFGTQSYPTQQAGPLTASATAPATPTGAAAPSPWATGTTTLTAPPTTNWGSASVSAPPSERSVLTTPNTTQPTASWSHIGNSIPAPPLIVPALPTVAPSSGSLSPFNTTAANDSGPSLTGNSSFGNQQSTSSTSNWSQQPSTTSTAISNDLSSSWSNSAGSPNNNATIGRTADSSNLSVTREAGFPATQQDIRNTAAKPADSWVGEGWPRNAQPNNAGDSIAASHGAGIGSASNSNQQAINGTFNSSFNRAGNGMNPNMNPPMQTANGEPQPWVTLLVVILALAGSLAGNVYLGWSYLDARQKYQALVRRTADTFRRSKSLAA